MPTVPYLCVHIRNPTAIVRRDPVRLLLEREAPIRALVFTTSVSTNFPIPGSDTIAKKVTA